VLDGGEVVARVEEDTASSSARLTLHIPGAKPWSPASPHLYDIRLRLLREGRVLDEIESYAGMRSVRLRDKHFLLNGTLTYLAMVLDQGYWPDGGMTAPTDEALRADVEWTKKFGFNAARKHQKIEDPRYLYWCDKLGVLVWGEMANARKWSPKAEEWLRGEWERAVRRDYNHPAS
jgi:beta-galactosidase/beta-glucuronidase